MLTKQENKELSFDELCQVMANAFDDKLHKIENFDSFNFLNFILGGNSIFTVKSLKTGNHLTFKVVNKIKKSLWYVFVLSGSNNDNDYTYIGYIIPNKLKSSLFQSSQNNFEFLHSQKSKISNECTSFKTFDYCFHYWVKNLNAENTEFYHHTRCCKCARLLTTPESIKSGIGPKCAGLS